MFTTHELEMAVSGQWFNLSGNMMIDTLYTDTRAPVENAMFVPLSGENFDGHDYIDAAIAQDARCIMCDFAHIEQYMHKNLPVFAVENTLQAYQKIAHYYRMKFKDLKVIAITGSSGKTSTKEILSAILENAAPKAVLATQGNTNNFVGVPQNLLRLKHAHKYAVIELGTNHPGEIAALTAIAEPNLAMISCIGASHLEFFGTPENVAKEKAMVFSRMRAPEICVYPAGCIGEEQILRVIGEKKHWSFGTAKNAQMNVQFKSTDLQSSQFVLTSALTAERLKFELPLPGEHQACNCAGAALIAHALGIDLRSVLHALKKVKLPGLRSRKTQHGSTTWINDAYNANPESMHAALKQLSDAGETKPLLVLGDMRELGQASAQAHETVLKSAREFLPKSTFILVGSAFTQACKKLGLKNIRCFETAAEACETVRSAAAESTLVLLKGSRGMTLEIIEPNA